MGVCRKLGSFYPKKIGSGQTPGFVRTIFFRDLAYLIAGGLLMAPGHYILFDLRFPCLRFCLFFTGSLAHAKAFFLHTPFPSYEADSKLPPTFKQGLCRVMTSLDWLLAFKPMKDFWKLAFAAGALRSSTVCRCGRGCSWSWLDWLSHLQLLVPLMNSAWAFSIVLRFDTPVCLAHYLLSLPLQPALSQLFIKLHSVAGSQWSHLLLRRHFRSCVIRLCGFTPEMDHVDHRGQRTKLGVFPIGANARPSNHTDSSVECNQSGGLGILMEGTWSNCHEMHDFVNFVNFAVLLWSFLIRCPSLAACVLCWGSGCDGSYEDSALQNSLGWRGFKGCDGQLWALLKDRTYAQLSTFCSSQPSPQLETLTPNRRKVYRARCPQLWFAVLPGDTTCKVGPMFLRAQNAGTQSVAFAKKSNAPGPRIQTYAEVLGSCAALRNNLLSTSRSTLSNSKALSLEPFEFKMKPFNIMQSSEYIRLDLLGFSLLAPEIWHFFKTHLKKL